MNPRERYMAVMEHREPDEVPINFEVHPALIPKMLALYGVQSTGDIGVDSEALDKAVNVTPMPVSMITAPKGWKIDSKLKALYDFTTCSPGVIKNETSYSMAYAEIEELGVKRTLGATIEGTNYRMFMYTYHPLAPGNVPFDDYEFPDIDEAERYDHARQMTKKYKNTMFCTAYLMSMYFRAAWQLRGFLQFMKDVYVNPELVRKLMEKLTERCITAVKHFADCGMDAILWNEDSGNSTSLFINYKKWQELIKPGYKAVNDAIHKRGMWSMWHGDGQLTEIVPDLIEVGFDSMHPLQPEVMDVYQIKEKYGDKLVINTGYPVMHLPYATSEEVKERVKKDIKVLAPGGGFIYGSSHVALQNTPPENIYTLAETIRKYAKYPIRVP